MNKNHDTPDGPLRDRILARCGSIRQFAIAAQVERTQIYPILRGEALPGLRNFVAMAGVLGLRLDELAELLGVDPRKEASK